MTEVEIFKRKNLLKLPVRNWTEDSTYYSILIVPTGKKHDSGWALMAIVGTNEKFRPIEIAAYCDDINWIIPEASTSIPVRGDNYYISDIHSDMHYPSNVMQMWSRVGKFKVGMSLSSTEITFIKDA
jgi:hypothetical protein